MLNDLLREIVISIVGKPADEIVELLNSPKHVNEFTIAKKLGITINQTRNILYRISDYGLVSSIRKKDKKKGWYTYFWRFEILKCLEFLEKLLEDNKKKIEEEVDLRKSKQFYECKLCNLEYDEDEALLMNFTCDECGQLFTVKDNSKFIKDLEKALLRINEKLDLVHSEMEKEKAKLERKKVLELKKEEKEKESKKKEKAKKAKAEREKRAAVKKAAKKKSVKKVSGVTKKVTKKTATKKTAKKATTKKATTKKAVKKKVTAKKTTTKKTSKKK